MAGHLRDKEDATMLRIPAFLRPRLTVAYAFCSGAALYIAYCFLFGKQLLSSNLPSYTGPYDVGAIDIEAPSDVGQLGNATFKDSGKPAFNLESVLFTIYYPAAPRSRSTSAVHPWIPRPLSLRAEGYARFAHINNFVTNRVFTGALWALAGGNTIPAAVDAPLKDKPEPRSAFGQIPIQVKADGKELPVVVFSHGMASSRTDYSAYCGELASRGYVVAIIEHRDGSCPGSQIIKNDGTVKDVLHFSQNQLDNDPPIDEAAMKKAQLAMRQVEVEETIRVLRLINDGNGEKVLKDNSRQEGNDLKNWKGQLNVRQVIIGGHSYGATLALQTLKDGPSEKLPISGGIILDPGKQSGPLNDDINVPVLVIHSSSWSRARSIFFGRPHFTVVKDLVEKALDQTGASWFLTSLETSHPSISDAPLIEPLLLSWTTGATIDVHEGLKQYVRVSIEFLEYLHTGKRTGVLAQNVTHAEYGEDSRTDEERKAAPAWLDKFWQVHVAPASS